MEKFYVIEEVEGSGLITPVEAENLEEAKEKYTSLEGGNFIVLNEEDYFNMCQAGVGC